MTTATLPRPATIHKPLDIRDVINPLPSQSLALDAMYRHRFVLFGGAAGPGKSYWLRWALLELLLYWASQGHRGVRVGLFCEDYPALRDRQIIRIKREFPLWLGTLKGSQDEGYGFFLRPQYGGGILSLRNLDDPAKYASAEFAAIGVDELTKNDRQTFDDLRFRLRWPGIAHWPFLAGTNPGSIGHGWVKKLWVDRDFSGDDVRLNPEQFVFIRARVQEMIENRPDLVDPEYLSTLNSLPEKMRRAMLDGDWDVFAGQVFSNWRRDLHVCEPFKIPDNWTRWTGIDYGFSSPFCCLWAARPPDKSRIVIYRELYATNWRAREQALRILDMSKGERMSLHAADPSMWQHRHETVGISIADEYEQAKLKLTKANNDRMAGLAAFREALDWKALPDGRVLKPPRLQAFSTCPNFIRTIPTLPYDAIKVEDVDTDAEDHAYDAGRYLLMAERQREYKPSAEPVKVYNWS